MKDCPSGKLTLIEFNEIYRQFFPAGDPTQFASFVFELFDEDKSGEIEFSEFLLALSITAKGEMEDKLECKC
jgi:Ca2+-binding EF-hand superfamily protein